MAIKTNPDDKDFIEEVKKLKVGKTIETEDGVLEVESIFDVPTHFVWHQTVFAPGMILKKKNSNVRIFIPAEKVGITPKHTEKGYFDDQQYQNGQLLVPNHSKARAKLK
jgi:hypothetical protein